MFDAFQAQQKAQKDEERKKKTEAAAALQGYRKTDLSEEETKLAALREQERLQKAAAAEALQKYRKAGLSEEEAKQRLAKQEELRKKQLLEEQLRTNGVVTSNDPSVHSSLLGMENSGAVSAMAAQFGVDGSYGGDVAAPAHAFAGASPRAAPAAAMAATAPPTTADSIPAAVPEGAPVDTAIDFMFGLITAATDQPVTDGYLARADQIAKTVLAGQASASAAGSADAAVVSLHGYPTVKAITHDPTRSDAQSSRHLVTVSIAFSAPNATSAKDFQTKVVAEIRSAIASGTFTRE